MTEHRNLIADNVHPLDPLPTSLKPQLTELKGIRAVLFDVYGTLLISASGDIGPADKSTAKSAALEEAICSAGLRLKVESAEAAHALHNQIERQSLRRARDGVQFPEIEIREVWKNLLPEICDLPDRNLPEPLLERLALHFELLSNPVWPMPGLRETLASIRQCGVPMGIISNAQFYTPPILEYFLGCSLHEAGFHPDLQVYSYRLREGKPSQRLYTVMAERLEGLNLKPTECLYVGNDMRNDIWPAAACGYHTALFAGDARSLRLRSDDPECASAKPDAVLQSLADINRILIHGCWH